MIVVDQCLVTRFMDWNNTMSTPFSRDVTGCNAAYEEMTYGGQGRSQDFLKVVSTWSRSQTQGSGGAAPRR